jgi:hypothetical protein
MKRTVNSFMFSYTFIVCIILMRCFSDMYSPCYIVFIKKGVISGRVQRTGKTEIRKKKKNTYKN